MPIAIHSEPDTGKLYFQFGGQKKYYFNLNKPRSITLAYKKCLKQAHAIKWSQNKSMNNI